MMVEQGFEEQPNNTLPRWSTLTEVSEALGIARNAVRSAARRALKRLEPWVKKEASGKILIDTHHAMYQCHAVRWKEQHTSIEMMENEEHEDDWGAPFKPSEGHRAMSYQWYPSLASEGYHQWPAFCCWLAKQGLQVFFNLLDDPAAPLLQWQWGDLHGEHAYRDIKEAVIAALDCRLNPQLAEYNWQDVMPEVTPPRSKGGKPRFWLFGNHNTR